MSGPDWYKCIDCGKDWMEGSPSECICARSPDAGTFAADAELSRLRASLVAAQAELAGVRGDLERLTDALREINRIAPQGTRTQIISFYALHPTNRSEP